VGNLGGVVQVDLARVNGVVSYDPAVIKSLLDRCGKASGDQVPDVLVEVLALLPRIWHQLLDQHSKESGRRAR
jgi:hypothetical protein